jgi:hypothetical protein
MSQMASEELFVAQVPVGRVRLWSVGPWGGVALIGVTLLLGFVPIAREEQRADAARMALWSVEGRPCKPLSPAVFSKVSSSPTSTLYDGVVFQRFGGSLMCSHIPGEGRRKSEKHLVCKFTGPDYLSVSSPGGTSFYDLTPSKAAGISIEGGVVKCAIVDRFKM